MARHLSDSDIEAIVGCIHGLERSSLTWETICDMSAALVGRRPTRQSICKQPAILSAYKSCKAKDIDTRSAYAKPASLSIAAMRIKRLESELEELKMINRNVYEFNLKIQYNAYKAGLKEWQLNEPLPPIDRERTDRD